jgi:hypothetical protein
MAKVKIQMIYLSIVLKIIYIYQLKNNESTETFVTYDLHLKNNNTLIDVETYNALIDCVQYQKEISTKILKTSQILKEMSQNGIMPNLDTFNKCLKNASKIFNNRSRDFALDILSEMKLLRISTLKLIFA